MWIIGNIQACGIYFWHSKNCDPRKPQNSHTFGDKIWTDTSVKHTLICINRQYLFPETSLEMFTRRRIFERLRVTEKHKLILVASTIESSSWTPPEKKHQQTHKKPDPTDYRHLPEILHVAHMWVPFNTADVIAWVSREFILCFAVLLIAVCQWEARGKEIEQLYEWDYAIHGIFHAVTNFFLCSRMFLGHPRGSGTRALSFLKRQSTCLIWCAYFLE